MGLCSFSIVNLLLVGEINYLPMFIFIFLLYLQSVVRATILFLFLATETRLLISWHMYCDLEVMKTAAMFTCFGLLFDQVGGNFLQVSLMVVLSPLHSEMPSLRLAMSKITCTYIVMFLLAYSISLCAWHTWLHELSPHSALKSKCLLFRQSNELW